jgi:hypothetical protein
MKVLAIVGVVLVLVGLAGLIQGGITYSKGKETTKLGPIDFTFEKKEKLPIHPALGGVVLAAGVVVVIAGTRSGGPKTRNPPQAPTHLG